MVSNIKFNALIHSIPVLTIFALFTLSCPVVIPGLFVRLMTKADNVLQPKNLSYFNVAVAAYAAGLAACFAANEIFHNGQPALLYLDPSLVGSTLACAAVNDQAVDLWEFREEEEEERKN